ncbi:MAG TPA: hypothetical protein VLZ72_07900 [Flavobacterium sp.]|nr:hypothetical protein [Flavobacterium sp.]
MKLQFSIQQRNAKSQVVFVANKVVNIGNDDVESVSKEIAVFCKDLQELMEYNKTVGLSHGYGLRKSLQTDFLIQGMDDFDDVTVSIGYKNFGKFVSETATPVIEQALSKSIAFSYKHSGTTLAINNKSQLLVS